VTDYSIPIGMTPDGIPVYEPSPALLAAIDAMEGRCVLSLVSECSGSVVERQVRNLRMVVCDGHVDG
jgi:hypothetical protein